ncbi:MAG: DUF177 domain-containing protein [Ruminococcaceae bacterium]|nr:DUF177 domain-containing protein [Oscillospiraceae bacterium]
MFVQCRSLFMGETTRLPLDTELDFTQVEFQGITPFPQPVRVVGEITARAGVVKLSARAVFTFHGRCDRCLAPFERAYDVPMEHILVTSLENEDSDYVLLEDYRLALDDLVQAAIFLELPYKSLCREDCHGLCPQCGKDLNEGPCGCQHKTVDPRLEILSQLL